jgi:hypothetical protein
VREIDLAPDALRLARCEPHLVALVVEQSTYPIDPSETERLIEGLAVGDPGFGFLRTHFVESDEQLGAVLLNRSH